jgi:hypothetical protein
MIEKVVDNAHGPLWLDEYMMIFKIKKKLFIDHEALGKGKDITFTL